MIKSTSQTNQQQFKLQLESIARLSSLPIVESSFHIANNVYNKIKVKTIFITTKIYSSYIFFFFL